MWCSVILNIKSQNVGYCSTWFFQYVLKTTNPTVACLPTGAKKLKNKYYECLNAENRPFFSPTILLYRTKLLCYGCVNTSISMTTASDVPNIDIWLQETEKEETHDQRVFCCTAFKPSSFLMAMDKQRRINGGPLRYWCFQLFIITFLPPMLSPATELREPAASLHPKCSTTESNSWVLTADEGGFKFSFPASFWKSWSLYTHSISPPLF